MISLPLLDHWPADRFPDPSRALVEPSGLLAFGGDLSPGRLRAAYAQGIFPWFNEGEPILWWSPDPRCVFRSADLAQTNRATRRLLARHHWQVSMDQAFSQVIRRCADPRHDQRGTWISSAMIDAYTALHALGHAHSVEVWQGERLVGGIYGVASGRLFSGESMFSGESGGSSVALRVLARVLHECGFPLIDAQVSNPHLLGLGAIELPRARFLEQAHALAAESPTRDPWQRMPRQPAASVLQ